MSYSCRCFSGNALFITVSYPGSMDHSRVPNDRDLHSASRPATIPCFLYCQSSQCPIACLDVHTAGPAPDCLLSEGQHGVTLLSRCSGGLIPLQLYFVPQTVQNSVHLISSSKKRREHNGENYLYNSTQRFQDLEKIALFSRGLTKVLLSSTSVALHIQNCSSRALRSTKSIRSKSSPHPGGLWWPQQGVCSLRFW